MAITGFFAPKTLRKFIDMPAFPAPASVRMVISLRSSEVQDRRSERRVEGLPQNRSTGAKCSPGPRLIDRCRGCRFHGGLSGAAQRTRAASHAYAAGLKHDAE